MGAGAMGRALTYTLIEHWNAQVTLVDRRHAAGGHWEDAYPFVRLQQASFHYGFALTALGGSSRQASGPEKGPARAGHHFDLPGNGERRPRPFCNSARNRSGRTAYSVIPSCSRAHVSIAAST